MNMDSENQGLLAPTQADLAAVRVFPLIPSLRKDVAKTIDSALSWEQLNASDINFSLVRPIVNRYARLKNMAVVYACLLVRSYFLAQSDSDLANAGVMQARAMLCEILAMKLLRRFASNHFQLVAVLATRWNPLAGASQEVIDEVKFAMGRNESDMESPQSALEMAISTQAKAFIASPVSQGVVNDIYSGRIVFTMAANRSILADNYKHKEIEIYDPRNAPFIDHYRLRVPRYGAILEFINFALLLLTFILCLSSHDATETTMDIWEKIFILFAAAFTLEEYTAAMERGWIIYMANLWNAFDFGFIMIFFAYLIFRIQGIYYRDAHLSSTAYDILACGACILVPRLAFFAVSNNVVILSLRAMVSQFVFFIGIAAICFSGLLFTLWTLGSDAPAHPWTLRSIAWLMVQIWFGNTYLSFEQASSFHPLFGPILMTVFAALSNTLLLTILISLLSNTVARIDANAPQEYLFQFAISTMEGVKSDALFSYQPPFNILAFIILKPASWILTPRALHSANVFLLKLTSLPTLITIAIYERHLTAGSRLRETGKGVAQSLFNSLPRHIQNMPLVEALVGSTTNELYEAIFDIDLASEFDLFGESDEDIPALRSIHSREEMHSVQTLAQTPSRRRKRPISANRSTHNAPSNKGSPNLKSGKTLSPLEPVVQTAGPSSGTGRSPLAMLFGQRYSVSESHPSLAAEANVKRLEDLVEEIRDLPIQRLKDEMKELQDRQARIEGLLLTLTRGMRNETHRQSTVG